MLDGVSYRDRVVGEDVSSRELRRVSAAESFRMPVRVDDAGAVDAEVELGREDVAVGFTFVSSSVSDSSSELDSSSEDDSSLGFAAAVAAVDWDWDWRNLD